MRCLTVLVATALATGCQVLASDPSPSLAHITLNGAEISYVAEGSGETLVFVHGPALDWRSGEGLRPLLAPRYRFVAYSRRHHFPNAWPDDGRTYTIAQHVEDLAALIRALGAKKAHLVGVSLGGRIVAETVVTHPELVASAVISDSFTVLAVTPENQAVMQAFFGQAEPMRAALKAGDALRAAQALFEWESNAPGAWSALDERRRREFIDNAATLLLVVADAGLDRRPTCDTLARTSVPVLVLDEAEIPLAVRLMNSALHACLPASAKQARLPNVGHFWYIDRPREGANAILRFVAQHPV